MGGTVSSGEDNDELVENLVNAGYIKNHVNEQALRLVDRGDYYLPQFRREAYKDMAWRNGNLHISAPCIYSEVLECLDVKPGMSFLNLGSGTGYLSTVVGSILGPNGVNHGVELHQDVVEYARVNLEEFAKTKLTFDMFELCPPKFFVGNCLLLDPSETPLHYDRVYCGAAVPTEHENFIKNLVKLGGIAVMPCGDQLRKFTRTGFDSWETRSVLPVSFASLVVPQSSSGTGDENAHAETVVLPGAEPLQLREICRVKIRQTIRSCLLSQHPEYVLRLSLLTKQVKKRSSSDQGDDADSGNNSETTDLQPSRARRQRRIFIPVFHDSDESGSDAEAPLRHYILATAADADLFFGGFSRRTRATASDFLPVNQVTGEDALSVSQLSPSESSGGRNITSESVAELDDSSEQQHHEQHQQQSSGFQEDSSTVTSALENNRTLEQQDQVSSENDASRMSITEDNSCSRPQSSNCAKMFPHNSSGNNMDMMMDGYFDFDDEAACAENGVQSSSVLLPIAQLPIVASGSTATSVDFTNATTDHNNTEACAQISLSDTIIISSSSDDVVPERSKIMSEGSKTSSSFMSEGSKTSSKDRRSETMTTSGTDEAESATEMVANEQDSISENDEEPDISSTSSGKTAKKKKSKQERSKQRMEDRSRMQSFSREMNKRLSSLPLPAQLKDYISFGRINLSLFQSSPRQNTDTICD